MKQNTFHHIVIYCEFVFFSLNASWSKETVFAMRSQCVENCCHILVLYDVNIHTINMSNKNEWIEIRWQCARLKQDTIKM